jgi:hypothetical protein
MSITLSDIATYVDKVIGPDEFNWEKTGFGLPLEDVAPPTSDNYNETQWVYKWVFDHFDLRRPIHRLALWLAFIVSKIVPTLFFSPTTSRLPSLPSGIGDNSECIRLALQSMPLYNRDNKKGHKDPVPYISIVTCVAIALWDNDSPMRQKLLTPRRGRAGTGDGWTEKHSMSISWLLL